MPAESMPPVLIVDDDAGIRLVLESMLACEGYTVISAANGREALAYIERELPGLVLLDLQMPVMTGWETLATIRARWPVLPVVFMSAGLNAAVQAAAYQADGYLAKPFDLDTLLQTVHRFLSSEPIPSQAGSSTGILKPSARATVAIVNANDDLACLLQQTVDAAGLVAVTAQVDDVGQTIETLQAFLGRYQATILLYDVCPPYPEHWARFAAVRAAERQTGTGRRFVATTPNKRALEERVGSTPAIELVGDGLDLEAIVRALRAAAPIQVG
jgi:CheY-like chemotaxis protein